MKKVSGKSVIKSSGRPNNVVNHGNRKMGGSRFEILSEELEENVGTTKGQSRVYKQKQTVSSKVLSDISNRGKTSNYQRSSQPKKVLEVNKGRFNKPFKEIAKGEGCGSDGKNHKIGKQLGKPDDNHQEWMEDELEDSDILKALHI